MKVLHVIPAIAPRYGGPSQVVIEMCCALRNLGVAAEIATTNADGRTDLDVPLDKLVRVKNVPVYYFQRWGRNGYKFSWQLTRWLEKHLREYDLLHIHSIFCYASTVAAYYGRRFRVPYLIRPLGVLDVYPLRRGRWKKFAYLWLLERENLHSAAAFHFTSEVERDASCVLNSPAARYVIPNGVPSDLWARPEGGDDFRSQYPSVGDQQIILFLGRLHPKKGLDLLVPAISCLAKKRQDFVLVIAGSGDESYQKLLRQQLKTHQINERTLMIGFVEGNQKIALLRNADVFVLPSYQENFGIAAAEAMAAALPVIISDQVQIHGEVAAANAGLVVPCKVEPLVEAINQLLDNPSLCKRMGADGRRLVKERYTWDKVAQKLVERYSEILSLQE
jgi:glycosyltransferase involved in cell wall biosynthesis